MFGGWGVGLYIDLFASISHQTKLLLTDCHLIVTVAKFCFIFVLKCPHYLPIQTTPFSSMADPLKSHCWSRWQSWGRLWVSSLTSSRRQADPICVEGQHRTGFFFSLSTWWNNNFLGVEYFVEFCAQDVGRRLFGPSHFFTFWYAKFLHFLNFFSAFQAQRDPLENLRLAVERAEAAGVEEDQLGPLDSC